MVRTPCDCETSIELMGASFALSPLPVAIVAGSAHELRYANPAFCELLRQPRELLVGQRLDRFLPAERGCARLIERVRRTGKAQTRTESLDPDPAAILWSYTLWPVGPPGPEAATAIQITESASYHEKMRVMNEALMLSSLRQHELRSDAESANAQLVVEIGERRQSELALVAMQAALAQSNQLLGDKAELMDALVQVRTAKLSSAIAELEAFSYSIAHDLRAPLRSMAGFADILLLDHLEQLNPAGQLCLKRIVKAAGLMDQLVRDVLNYGQILKSSPNLTPVDVNVLIQETLGYYPIFSEHDAEIAIEGPFPSVRGNPALLMQVFSQVMSNAIKFAKPDERARLRVWAEPRDSAVRFFFQDQGIGIPPEQHERIFGIFERLNPVYDGTGIGLAIVKKGIERMGGTVGVISEFGQGATFWFDLQPAS